MKKILAGAVAVGCLTVAGMASAAFTGYNVAGSGVNGSLHDMTRVVPATADDMGRVCVYCHAPHHAQKDSDAAMPDNYPLWNHKFSEQVFIPYDWATPNNAIAGIDVLAGPSRLCMTCHDGSVAIDEHGTTGNGTMKQSGSTLLANLNGGRANLTKDLSNTHPIGFNYVEIAGIRNTGSTGGVAALGATVGSEIVAETNGYATGITLSTVDGEYNTVTRSATGKKISDNLFGGTVMTCATCHEVHNKENVVQDALKSDPSNRPNYFLYAKQTDSLICLSCHVK